MDSYFWYNQIYLSKNLIEKMAFMTEQADYQYNVPFRLKNMGAMFQRIMIKFFWKEIGERLEVSMDYMIVKSNQE